MSTNTTAAFTNTTTINVHDAVAQGGPTLPQRKTPVVPSLAPPIRAAPLALLAAAPQPQVLRLAERAARLAGAVEGLRQGLADSAEVLSPRTRVLQAALMAATAGET